LGAASFKAEYALMFDCRSRRWRLWLVACLVGVWSAIPSAGQAGVPAAGTAPFSHYVLPVIGPAVVLTPFRAPASRYGSGHRGVDLVAAAGGSVVAAGAGIVAFAGPVAGRGVVSINHPDGIRTTYEPVSPVVASGERVAPGQLIGTLLSGHPSCSPATCLHWGARLADGFYLDPMGLITGLRVRLLPWS
jgi:murein DD-endopeptidase MepM/ murein hydrolase activator NlpD